MTALFIIFELTFAANLKYCTSNKGKLLKGGTQFMTFIYFKQVMGLLQSQAQIDIQVENMAKTKYFIFFP